jgi:PPOX class probable F420-dependent enzyme
MDRGETDPWATQIPETTRLLREGHRPRPRAMLAPTMGDPHLADAKYVNLETFKKDGTGVKTPVWVAGLEGRLVIFTDGTSYKVRRLRNNPKVRVAECDARGKVLGPWVDGTGRVLEDEAHAERAHAALRRKYGLLMGVTDFFSGIAGRKKRRAYLEINLG